MISVGKLVKNGNQVQFNKHNVKIQGPNYVVTSNEINNLYILNLELVNNYTRNEWGFKTTADNSNSELWHRRLGHLNCKEMKNLGFVPSEKCSKCIERRVTRRPFLKRKTRSLHIGELIHSDLSGPITPTTPAGHKYFQVIIDDYSHFTIVKLLKNKSEAEENLMEYIKNVQTQHNVKVKKIRVDNGGEFTSNNFKNFCTRKGIQLQYSRPYSPQQNGLSERIN